MILGVESGALCMPGRGLYKLSDNSRTSVLFFIETVFSHYKDINYFKIFLSM